MLENPVHKRAAIGAAIGAVVAIPLPFIGPIIGALVGGGVGREAHRRLLQRHRLGRAARALVAKLQDVHAVGDGDGVGRLAGPQRGGQHPRQGGGQGFICGQARGHGMFLAASSCGGNHP